MYGRFLAFQRHFTSKYDGFKYHFKVKTNQSKFMERNDRFLFHKLSKHEDPDGLMISNFLVRDNIWVNDLLDNRAEEAYNEWKRRKGTLTYNFKSELSKFSDREFNELLAVKDGQFPFLLRKYMGKEISPETLLGIQELTNVFKMWDKNINDDIFWPEIKNKLLKYRPFIELKKEALREVVIDIFSEK